MEKTNHYLTRKEIRAFFGMLASSQGFYGRLLRDIDNLDAEQANNFWNHLEAQKFTDTIDIILYLEC